MSKDFIKITFRSLASVLFAEDRYIADPLRTVSPYILAFNSPLLVIGASQSRFYFKHKILAYLEKDRLV